MPTPIEKIFEDVQLHVKFTQASSRSNIVTYDPTDAEPENISTAFGKLSTWYEALVPTGGSDGKILAWNTAGTAKWSDPLHPSVTKSADTTSTASPGYSGTFTTVDTVTRDAYGHVTKINTKTITLPANPVPSGAVFTDANVTQTPVGSTYTNFHPLLIGASSGTSAGFTPTLTTAGTYATAGIYCQPSSGYIYASDFMTNTYPSGTGSSLSQYGLYLKSYFKCADSSQTVLQYAGYGVRTYSGKITSSDGIAVAVGCGGLTVLGSGESAHNLISLISDDQKISGNTTLNVGGTLNTTFAGNTEVAIVSSDDSIYFITNCQTIANRKPVCLNTSSYFYPGTNKTGSIGTSSYMWNSVYAATIYENGTSLASKYAAIGHTHGLFPSDVTLSGGQLYLSGGSGSYGQLNLKTASYNVMFRNDNVDTYILLTAKDNPNGSWTSARPLMINNSTGVCSINGNAATSSSWATARTLTLGGQLTGSVSVKGDANMTLSGYLDRAFIYDDNGVPKGHTWAEYAWHKFAEVTITGVYEDRFMTLHVSRSYSGAENTGILSVRLRTNGNKAFDTASFVWLVRNSGLSKDDFVMVYTSTSGTSTKAELWCRIPGQYSGFVFTVLKEHRRHYSTDTSWILVKTPDGTGSTHGSSSYPTTGITGTIISSDGTITNSTIGNAATATTATKVATEVGSSAGARPVFYAYLGDNTRVVYNTNFTYNPSGNVLTATTFAGTLSGNVNGKLYHTGTSSSWWNDRDNAVIRITTGDTVYRPLWTLLTATSGSWGMGNHTGDDLTFNFISKTVYDSKANPSTNVQIKFTNTGAITANGLTLSSSNYGPLSIIRTGHSWYAGIKFYNNGSTYLGSFGITTVNGRFIRFNTDEATEYEIIDRSVVRNNTTVGTLGWTSVSADTVIPTVNTIAYWNGAHSGTSSNLAYCKQGAFGTIVTKSIVEITSITTVTANKKFTCTANTRTYKTFMVKFSYGSASMVQWFTVTGSTAAYYPIFASMSTDAEAVLSVQCSVGASATITFQFSNGANSPVVEKVVGFNFGG